MSGAIRVGLVGATTTLGREVASLLSEPDAPQLGELRAFDDQDSSGEELEWGEDWLEVRTGARDFSGLDAVVLCTTPGRALEDVRLALRVEVPCIDCSGSLLGSSEVSLAMAGLSANETLRTAALVSSPADTSLAWAPVLSILRREVGLVRVVGTVLHSASLEGRAGIDELSAQTLALLSQSELPESKCFAGPVAFDCLPHLASSDAAEKDGAAQTEGRLVNSLRRLLDPDLKVAVTGVQVPMFAGEGSALCVETREPAVLEDVSRWLDADPHIVLAADALQATTRACVGGDQVRVARIRRDLSAPDPERSLLLWLSADPIRLAARNVIQLLDARFSGN